MPKNPGDYERRKRKIEETLNEEFTGSKMSFFQRLKKSMFHSSGFFDEIRSEEGIGKPLKFLAIVSAIFSLIFAAIFAVIGYLLGSFFQLVPGLSYFGNFFSSMFAAFGLVIGIILWVLIISFSFIGVAISHLFVKIVGGQGSYTQTYKAYAYSMSAIVFFWVPVANLLFVFLQLYNYLVGLSMLHEISKKRALLSLVLQLAVSLVLLILLAILVTGTVAN
ncbi:MAG: YIP1 family protein [Candidatus Aenigmarchaeota archaeon]|nr:YIP1 family protein [Candidatus Aenigmarchaeota archaeon]MDI6722520.1 YIP1 family protein [Candidatus Aenigmarchaeota archaeon]